MELESIVMGDTRCTPARCTQHGGKFCLACFFHLQCKDCSETQTITIRLAETVGVLPKEALFVVPRHASNGARSPGFQNAGEYGCLGVSDGLCR